MKKFVLVSLLFWTVGACLTGCTISGEKSTNLTIIYGIAAILSLLLLVGCFLLVRQKRTWFVLLFSSVLVVNVGYACLALSSCLETALMANRLSYLGSVFLPLSMLMIILDVTNTPYKKRLPCILFGIAVVIFMITASAGILPIYYKAVSFAVVDGVSTLVKTYGPLHPVYLLYLVGYFAAMVAIILRASVRKTTDTTSHAAILAGAVFVNIGVWLIEQFVSVGFEMLSISYIISEVFLLGVHLLMREHQKMREFVKSVETVQHYAAPDLVSTEVLPETSSTATPIEPTKMEAFIKGIDELTPTERIVFDAHIERLTTKEILEKLSIKENTLKYHNKNIYNKLGVSSRKELLELHKYIQFTKIKIAQNTH